MRILRALLFGLLIVPLAAFASIKKLRPIINIVRFPIKPIRIGNIMDQFTRIDESKIAPFFLEKAKQLIEALNARGVKFYAISGYRDPKEQEALYAIGRTIHPEKKPVTNAKPYSSFHNFGLAIDFCRSTDITRDCLTPDWKFEDYKILAEEAVKIGLEPGYNWNKFPEGPHVQVPFVVSTTNMHLMLEKEGESKLWAFVLNTLRTNPNTKKFWTPDTN